MSMNENKTMNLAQSLAIDSQLDYQAVRGVYLSKFAILSR